MSNLGWLNIASDESIEDIDERMRRDQVVTPTGLPDLDAKFFLWGDRRGIPQGTYVLLAGASNVGKTLFGLHMLLQAARSLQVAGMISLDMKNRDAIARLHQALVPTIGFSNWRPSRWKPGNADRIKADLTNWRSTLASVTDHGGPEFGEIVIQEDRNRSLGNVCDRIREGAELGITFFAVDHMQKIRVPELRGNAFGQADAISEAMDDLVDELDVTIVGLSQLNRMASREIDRRPTMFDIHGGTSMESNTGVVLMLDHSRVKMDPDKHNLIRTWLLLEKNQIGPKNVQVPILVDAAKLSVTQVSEEEAKHLWPQADPAKKGKAKR